jgi:hypothetical protein
MIFMIGLLHGMLSGPRSAPTGSWIAPLGFETNCLWNKARTARIHHPVEPLPGLDPVDLVERVLRERGDVEILASAFGSLRRGQHRRTPLHGPRKQHLRGRLAYSVGDRNHHRVFQRPRPDTVTKRGESQQHDPLLTAEVQQLRLRQIGVRLHLNHGRFDGRRLIKRCELLQTDVGQTDGPAFALNYETLHRLPRLQQRHPIVVEDIAGGVSRVLGVPRLECERRVHEVEIEVVEPQPVQTGLEGRLDPFRPMVGVPELRCDEDVLACHAGNTEACPKRLTDLPLVPIAFRAVEVAKTGVQSVTGRAKRHARIRYQSAEPSGRDLAGSVLKWDAYCSKVARFIHETFFHGGALRTIDAVGGPILISHGFHYNR